MRTAQEGALGPGPKRLTSHLPGGWLWGRTSHLPAVAVSPVASWTPVMLCVPQSAGGDSVEQESAEHRVWRPHLAACCFGPRALSSLLLCSFPSSWDGCPRARRVVLSCILLSSHRDACRSYLVPLAVGTNSPPRVFWSLFQAWIKCPCSWTPCSRPTIPFGSSFFVRKFNVARRWHLSQCYCSVDSYSDCPSLGCERLEVRDEVLVSAFCCRWGCRWGTQN